MKASELTEEPFTVLTLILAWFNDAFNRSGFSPLSESSFAALLAALFPKMNLEPCLTTALFPQVSSNPTVWQASPLENAVITAVRTPCLCDCRVSGASVISISEARLLSAKLIITLHEGELFICLPGEWIDQALLSG